MAVHSVGVVGSGQMGNGIAQVAACSGKEVIMVDIKEEFLERGVSTISKSLDKLASKGRINQEQITVADLTGVAVQDIQISKAVLRNL